MAGFANLATQGIVERSFPNGFTTVSILTGTAIGFLVKYVLDKRWVFVDGYDSHAAELRKVVIYAIFGVGTTLLFWATELSFLYFGRTAEAKYVGAAVGLALGNWIKYLLDREYVFRGSRR